MNSIIVWKMPLKWTFISTQPFRATALYMDYSGCLIQHERWAFGGREIRTFYFQTETANVIDSVVEFEMMITVSRKESSLLPSETFGVEIWVYNTLNSLLFTTKKISFDFFTSSTKFRFTSFQNFPNWVKYGMVISLWDTRDLYYDYSRGLKD